MLEKLREYRWELWLFFGIPVVADVVLWGSLRGLPSSDWTALTYAAWLLSAYGMWLFLLGISYRWVHRSGRELLRLLWQYSLTLVPLGVAHSLVSAWVYGLSFERIGVEEGDIEPYWITLLWWAWRLTALLVLVWFARRASRNGFDKALVLIGVTAFPGLDFLAEYYWTDVKYGIGALALKVLLSFIAIWALHGTDTGKAVGTKGIWVLFAAAMAAYVLPFAAQDIENSFSYGTPILGDLYGWLYGIIPLVAAYGIAVLAAYLIRMRRRHGMSLPEAPSAPSTSICSGD